ncbi:MAG: DUF2332 domain-containing protein [Novosphingobium sp.]|nr:DUF2332 domain-containing protein [Novosphingobium sp.]
MSDNLILAFDYQVKGCAALGAPFSSRILELAAKDITAGGITAQLLRDRADLPADQLIRDAVALRLLASLHHLVLGGHAPELASCHPPRADDPDRAWEIAKSVLSKHSDLVVAMLDHEPQTNEVRRSACLLGGFLMIAQETGLPLRCFELGASAGLNSLWDRFHYAIGDATWGDPKSTVRLSCNWTGPAPSLATELCVAERHACDRRPVNLRQPGEAIRLLSYCWGEQGERMARLRAALALVRDEAFKVDAETAATWVCKAAPMAGTATVLFHSIMWQYMPPEEQAAARAALAKHVARASPDQPFYWLRMEHNEVAQQFELRLLAWNKDDDRLLAVVHPHGEFAHWQ